MRLFHWIVVSLLGKIIVLSRNCPFFQKCFSSWIWYGLVWFGMVWYGLVCFCWYSLEGGGSDDFHGWHSFMDDFHGWLSWMTTLIKSYILITNKLMIDRLTYLLMDGHWYLLSCYRDWKWWVSHFWDLIRSFFSLVHFDWL